MANSNSLLNIASLLLNNLDITSIVKTMLNKIDMGQLTGMISGNSGSGNGNAAANSANQGQQASTAAQSSNNTGSFLQGLNINSFAPPIQTLNTQAMTDIFSQMFGGIAPIQGYQMPDPFFPTISQGLINPYPISSYYNNYYGGYYMPPEEDLE